MQIKLIKKIQMTIIVVFIIFSIIVMTGLFTGDNVIAYSSHKLKAADFIKTEFYMTHTTYYVCTECDYKTKKTEDCKLINFKKISEEKHIAECDDCLDKYELPHIDENNDGKCDDCKCTVNGGKHICLQHSNEKILVFDYAYHDYYAICTLCENPVPDWQKREPHNFGEFTSKGTKGHSATCKICGYELIQEHQGANHKNEGKCTINGCGHQYEIHKKTTTLTGEYVNITKTTHIPLYKCSQKGCIETYKGNAEYHKYDNGQCKCGQIEEVVKEIEITSKKYKIDNNYILDVQPETTVSEFKSNIQTNGTQIKIYTNNNQLVSSTTKIGTGMKIEIKNGNQTKTFIIIVNGDVNGDGKTDFKDLVKINQSRLNKTHLDEVYSIAADVTVDAKIDFKDLVKINRFRLNKDKI